MNPRMWFSAKIPTLARRSAALKERSRPGILRSSQPIGYIGAARKTMRWVMVTPGMPVIVSTRCWWKSAVLSSKTTWTAATAKAAHTEEVIE